MDITMDNMLTSIANNGYHQGYQWIYLAVAARPSATTSPNTTWMARPATLPRTEAIVLLWNGFGSNKTCRKTMLCDWFSLNH